MRLSKEQTIQHKVNRVVLVSFIAACGALSSGGISYAHGSGGSRYPLHHPHHEHCHPGYVRHDSYKFRRIECIRRPSLLVAVAHPVSTLSTPTASRPHTNSTPTDEPSTFDCSGDGTCPGIEEPPNIQLLDECEQGVKQACKEYEAITPLSPITCESPATEPACAAEEKELAELGKDQDQEETPY